MKVLIVEDNRTDAALVRRALEDDGGAFEVDVAVSLREAVERIDGNRGYDAALVDLRLPDGDGMMVLGEIRRRNLPVCVVLVTGFGDENVAVASLKAGADDYVVKSGKHYKQLPAILRKCLEERRNLPEKNPTLSGSSLRPMMRRPPGLYGRRLQRGRLTLVSWM